MKKSFVSFLINHTLITTFLALFFLAIKFQFPQFPIPEPVYIIFAFFLFFVPLIHGILLKVSTGKPQVFVRVFMVATFLKLFVYLAFISTIILIYRNDAKGIIIVFAVLYFVNLGHEILAILKHFRQQKSDEQEA